MSIYSEFKTAFFNRGERADFSFRWKSYAYHCITYPVGNGWFVESYIVRGDSIEVIDRLADETDFKRELLCIYADGKFYIPKAYSGFDTYLNPLEEGFFMVGAVAELHRQQFLSKDFITFCDSIKVDEPTQKDFDATGNYARKILLHDPSYSNYGLNTLNEEIIISTGDVIRAICGITTFDKIYLAKAKSIAEKIYNVKKKKVIVDFYRENPDLVTKEWERRMADALVDLSDTANVTVTFAFKGSMESEKISVENVLRCLRDSTYISPYQFVTNKAGKVLMAKLGLSISDDLHCYDIVSIKYGKKILFERQVFLTMTIDDFFVMAKSLKSFSFFSHDFIFSHNFITVRENDLIYVFFSDVSNASLELEGIIKDDAFYYFPTLLPRIGFFENSEQIIPFEDFRCNLQKTLNDSELVKTFISSVNFSDITFTDKELKDEYRFARKEKFFKEKDSFILPVTTEDALFILHAPCDIDMLDDYYRKVITNHRDNIMDYLKRRKIRGNYFSQPSFIKNWEQSMFNVLSNSTVVGKTVKILMCEAGKEFSFKANVQDLIYTLVGNLPLAGSVFSNKKDSDWIRYNYGSSLSCENIIEIAYGKKTLWRKSYE